jgi:hypothetical protein
MDILAILCDRLSFIERFYHLAAAPFATVKRQIEGGEDPFAPRYVPGDHDGPEFLSEWIEAEDMLRTLGQCTLGVLEKALQDYLREFIMREHGILPANLPSELEPFKKKDGWFGAYVRLLEMPQTSQSRWS